MHAGIIAGHASTGTSLHGALEVSQGGLIEILSGRPPAEEFATLSHELAHEILHCTGRAEGLGKRARELEAEAVAFAVCKGVGLDPGTTCQDYIHLHVRRGAGLARPLSPLPVHHATCAPAAL